MRSARSLQFVVVATMFLFTLVGAGAQQAPASAPARAATARTPRAPVDDATREQRTMARMWWNRPDKIEALSLSQGTRTKLDVMALEYLRELRANTAQRDTFAAFSKALEAGDWEGARQQLRPLGEAHAAPTRGQAELMIEGMKLLTPEQRKRIAKDFPGLTSGPWVLTRGVAGSAERGRRTAPAAR